MADESPRDIAEPTCGFCKYAKPADETQIACFGVPPSVVLLGARPGRLAGQVQYQFESLRPIIPNTDPACSLYKPRGFATLIGH